MELSLSNLRTNHITDQLRIKVILDQLDKSNTTRQSDTSQQLNKLYSKPVFTKAYQSVINENPEGSIAVLSPKRKHILTTIYSLIRSNRTEMSQVKLATLCGVTRRTINTAVALFRELGLLEVSYRHRDTCVYGIPSYISSGYIWTTINAIIRPTFKNFEPIFSPIIYMNSKLDVLRDHLVNNDQKMKQSPEWGREFLEAGDVVAPVADLKTLKGDEKVMKQSPATDNTRQSIKDLRSWLELTEKQEEVLMQFDDAVLEATAAQVRPKAKSLYAPTPYFITACHGQQKKHLNSPSFFKNKTSTTDRDQTTAKKNPMYKPWVKPDTVIEDPLTAAANLQANRTKMMDNLKFMGTIAAQRWVDSLILSYVTEAETGIEQDRRYLVGELMGPNKQIVDKVSTVVDELETTVDTDYTWDTIGAYESFMDYQEESW